MKLNFNSIFSWIGVTETDSCGYLANGICDIDWHCLATQSCRINELIKFRVRAEHSCSVFSVHCSWSESAARCQFYSTIVVYDAVLLDYIDAMEQKQFSLQFPISHAINLRFDCFTTTATTWYPSNWKLIHFTRRTSLTLAQCEQRSETRKKYWPKSNWNWIHFVYRNLLIWPAQLICTMLMFIHVKLYRTAAHWRISLARKMINTKLINNLDDAAAADDTSAILNDRKIGIHGNGMSSGRM